jgi:hypothetical protein
MTAQRMILLNINYVVRCKKEGGDRVGNMCNLAYY